MIVQCKLVPVVGSHYAVGCFGCGLCLFAVGGAVKALSEYSETSWESGSVLAWLLGVL